MLNITCYFQRVNSQYCQTFHHHCILSHLQKAMQRAIQKAVRRTMQKVLQRSMHESNNIKPVQVDYNPYWCPAANKSLFTKTLSLSLFNIRTSVWFPALCSMGNWRILCTGMCMTICLDPLSPFYKLSGNIDSQPQKWNISDLTDVSPGCRVSRYFDCYNTFKIDQCQPAGLPSTAVHWFKSTL